MRCDVMPLTALEGTPAIVGTADVDASTPTRRTWARSGPRYAYAAGMAVNQSRRSRAARKRKRRMGLVEHDLSDAQWAALQDAWGGCAYCGATDRPLQRDCVLAVSRGGRYTLDNIAPACGPCNASKGNEEVTGWLRRKKYDEEAFLVRHLEITRALAPVGTDVDPQPA
jgi:5-methylcytosine-specific restriction endonuclease McrA